MARGLARRRQRICWVDPARVRDVERLIARLLAADPARRAPSGRVEAEVRARFARLAEPAPDGEGFVLAQPMRLDLLVHGREVRCSP